MTADPAYRPAITLVAALLLTACAPDRTPTWAADTLHLQPAEGGQGMTGFATWTLYGPRWEASPRERFYACAMVVELELEPCTSPACSTCPECTHAWDVSGTLADSDCEQDHALPELRGLALAPLDPELAGDPRFADGRLGTWTRYSDGDWVAHGWADFGGPEPDPVPDEPSLTGWPAWAWPLE